MLLNMTAFGMSASSIADDISFETSIMTDLYSMINLQYLSLEAKIFKETFLILLKMMTLEKEAFL